MKPVTFVKQADGDGCGIACVAMASKRSYSYVKQLAYSKNHNGSCRTWGKQLEKLLKECGVEVELLHRIKKLEELDRPAIIKVELKQPQKNSFHWILISELKKNSAYRVADPEKVSIKEIDQNKFEDSYSFRRNSTILSLPGLTF